MDIIISFGQVEKDHANISTVIPVNNSCSYINVMLPRETGSKECVVVVSKYIIGTFRLDYE